MKKAITLILALCMLLLAIPAFAEEAVVLQNEKAPVIVPVGVENEVTIVATVHAADGTVYNVAEGDLVLTDVHDRTVTEDEVIAKRLTDAYEGVMADVHFSDVACIKHAGEILTPDIDAALAGHPDELIAYDLVMYELFDVMLQGEHAAALKDGAVMAFTVKLEAEQSLPLMILYTPDGAQWQILETYTFGADKTIDILLEQPGTLAFLLSGKATEEDEKRTEELIPGTGTDPEGGFDIENGPFTPSASGKTAPTIVYTEGEAGEEFAGTIVYTESETAKEVPLPESRLVVTPLAERDFVLDIQTHEHLEWAYDDILTSEKISMLEEGLAEAINKQLADAKFELDCDALLVRDLFELTVYGEYLEYFYQEDAQLTITFEANADQDEPFVVLFSSDSVTWQLLDAENLTIHANGNVTLKLHELGVVAFLTENPQAMFGADAVQAP